MAYLRCLRATRRARRKAATAAHVLIEGELVYREYERTVETDSGLVKVEWPVTEVVIDSVKTPDGQAKDKGAAA